MEAERTRTEIAGRRSSDRTNYQKASDPKAAVSREVSQRPSRPSAITK